MNKETKWTDDLRRKADAYRRKAPEGLLGDIKREMAQRGVVAGGNHRRMTVVWTRRVAVTAAVAAMAALVVRMVWPVGETPSVAVTGHPSESQAQPAEHNMIAEAAEDGSSANGRRTIGGAVAAAMQRIAGAVGGKTEAAAVAEGIASDEKLMAIASKNEDNDDDGATIEPDNEALGSEAESKATAQRPSALMAPAAIKESRSNRTTNWYAKSSDATTAVSGRRHGMALAMNYTGMGTASSGQGIVAANVASDPVCFGLQEIPNDGALSKAAMPTTTTAHHDMPVKLGVSLRYDIDNRWSVMTGVNYSYLSSAITVKGLPKESFSKQKLHYVSLPIMVSYSVWRTKNFNVYMAAGGEAAKLVKGKAAVEEVSYSSTTPTKRNESITEHRLQYSLSGLAGVEYNATDRMSIFAEPGFSYFFDNHSPVVNIYKDKPAQFTINLGLRLDLGSARRK